MYIKKISQLENVSEIKQITFYTMLNSYISYISIIKTRIYGYMMYGIYIHKFYWCQSILFFNLQHTTDNGAVLR